MALAEQTDCDVRSCLHTLQFLSRRTRTVRPVDIDGARVGQKDVTKNAFAAWQELFWLRVSAGHQRQMGLTHRSRPRGIASHRALHAYTAR